jgi:predicted nucleic acid-binding protein
MWHGDRCHPNRSRRIASLPAPAATAVSSGLARAEVGRALLPLGEQVVCHGEEVLDRLELIRISDRILTAAATLLPAEVRALDAIHIATARQLGSDLARVVT